MSKESGLAQSVADDYAEAAQFSRVVTKTHVGPLWCAHCGSQCLYHVGDGENSWYCPKCS